MKQIFSRIGFGILLSFCLSGCVSLPEKQGFVFQKIQTSAFDLASWARVERSHPFLRIYLEGDGFAWRTPYRPSYNPTPLTTLVLDLAEKDKNNNVVYLARPCQYIFSKQCDVYFWTIGRFDERIIQAQIEAVKHLIQTYQAKEVQLIGYSGGATVALLVALNVPEVSSVITLAGVLDHEAWTTYHQDTPLKGSLNPMAEKKRLALLPQRHYVGEKDKTVPPALTQAYLASFDEPHFITRIVLPEVSHQKGWDKAWEEILPEIEPLSKPERVK